MREVNVGPEGGLAGDRVHGVFRVKVRVFVTQPLDRRVDQFAGVIDARAIRDDKERRAGALE